MVRGKRGRHAGLLGYAQCGVEVRVSQISRKTARYGPPFGYLLGKERTG
jgi:hypothetical protein